MTQNVLVTQSLNQGRTHHGDARPTAIVIGAGFGGLAAAIRLSARGFRVTVVESRSQPGGRAGQIVDRGFTFDTGPTLITVPELLEDLWAVAGKSLQDDIELKRLDPFYRIQFKDGSVFEYADDPDLFDDEIRSFNADDVAGYRRFLASTERIYDRAFADLGHVPFDSLSRFLRVVPELVRLGGLKSVYQVASSHIQDERLRTALSFHPLFIGGNPLRASAIYSIVPYLEKKGGVHFAMGGMYSLIKAMVRLLEDLGGELLLNTPVSRILTTARGVVGVQTSDGRALAADTVVANSDAATTLLELLPAENRSKFWSRYWQRSRYSMSCYLLYLGLSRTYPELRHHTIVMPRDFRGVVGEIFDSQRIPRDIPMYIHTPTRTDPGMAPDGCDSMYVLVPVPNLQSGIDWSTAGDSLRERVLNELERVVGLDDIRESILVEHRFTPVDFRDELGSYLGAAFSIEPTLMQSAYFRPHNVIRGVDGLYLVGAGTHPGAGVPGVLLSAEITADLIFREHSIATHRMNPSTRASHERSGDAPSERAS